jgi:site-specific recombinase XerD
MNKNASPRTITAYRNDLKLFEAFLLEHGIRRISQVNHAVINNYIGHMEQQPNPRFHRAGLQGSSIARRLATVSGYFDYVRAMSNPRLRNPLRDLTRRWKKDSNPKPVDEIVLEKLLAGITEPRDRVLIMLFLATGLRVSEVYQLNCDTIQLYYEIDDKGQEKTGGSGHVVGKGGKKRAFFVDSETAEIYAEYLATRADENPALFLSERKQRMSVRAIQYTLTAWCRKLGLSHVRIHQLRHSYATRLANSRINSMVLKDLMGHNSLSTTLGYSQLHESTLAQGYFSAMEFLNQQPN